MSDASASPTGLTAIDETAGGGHTLVVGSRLMLAANATLQLTMLFTYLYLRANNFGGMWHPSGVSSPPEAIALAALVLPLIGVVALLGVSSAAARGSEHVGSLKGLLVLALAAVVLTGAVRIFLMYQFGWDLQNGSYIDVSTVWYGVVLAEFIAVGLWLLSIVMGHVRGQSPISTAQARAVLEQWTFVTGVAIVVYLLVQFLT